MEPAKAMRESVSSNWRVFFFLGHAMLPKQPYAKPATTYAKQVEMLRDRGMSFQDEEKAKLYLQHLNYYRLGAYWLPFEEDHATHKFKTGTTFESVLTLYTFDRELRLLLLDAVERIEVSVRAQWAYRMGHLHGPHSHLDQGLAQNCSHWQSNIDDLKKEVGRADETFIPHLSTTYAEDLPPVWAACEVMSLGLLSRWFSNLKPAHTRRLISGVYHLDESVFASWLHHLSVIRNICAHHSRLWDRAFNRVSPKAPLSKPARIVGEFTDQHRLYNTLVILLHFMDIISPDSSWRERLKALLTLHPQQLGRMGFPDNWEARLIWQ